MKLEKIIPFQRVKNSLHTCYILPSENDKKNMTKFLIISWFIKVFTFCFFVLGGFLHLVNVLTENIEELDASEDIVVVSAGIGTVLMLVMFTVLQKKWESFLDDILDFSVYGKPDKIDEILIRGNVWGRWIGYYYIFGCFIYGGISYEEGHHCNRLNRERNLHLICDTFVPIWLPFDIPSISIRYLIFLIQLILVVIAVNPGAMICFLTFQCTEVLILHIESLKTHFGNIVASKDFRYRPDGFGYWVRYHNHILNLAETLRILVKMSVGHIILISALVFGCAETQIVKGVKPLGALIFFVGWLVAVLLLCHAGEILMNSALSIHDAVRDSNWISADLRTQRDIVLILLKSQKPIYLDALPLGAMNYSLFLMSKISFWNPDEAARGDRNPVDLNSISCSFGEIVYSLTVLLQTLLLKTSYSYMTLLNQSV